MEAYKKEFIEFMVDCQVLKFGDFVTKSGRKTPFFVNTGFYRTGAQLRKLGAYYAEAINERFGLDPDVVAMADEVLEIPSHGMKNSLNVVSAFAVAAAFFRTASTSRKSSGVLL